MIRKIVCVLGIVVSASSCAVVKDYEKVYLNDDEMVLGLKDSERFETTFQIYREAASGANGGKTGGGCGCN